MKSINVKICVMIAMLGAILGFSSCSKNSDPGTPTVKFSAASATYNEDQGAVNVGVTLSRKLSADVTVNFTWTGGSNTFLDGDFTLTNTSSITITAGQTTGQIQLQVIDDTQIDNTDSISFVLSSTSNNARLSTAAADVKSSVYVTNNDSDPANTLQADLVWSTGATSSVDNADLDLVLVYGVTLDGMGNISNPGTAYHSSTNVAGFETLFVASGDTDQTYYFAIPYISGSAIVNFTLTINGFGWTNGRGHNTFAAADAGTAFFFGPFTKSGTTFPNQRTMNLVPKGELKMIKVENFNMPK